MSGVSRAWPVSRDVRKGESNLHSVLVQVHGAARLRVPEPQDEEHLALIVKWHPGHAAAATDLLERAGRGYMRGPPSVVHNGSGPSSRMQVLAGAGHGSGSAIRSWQHLGQQCDESEREDMQSCVGLPSCTEAAGIALVGCMGSSKPEHRARTRTPASQEPSAPQL